MLNVLDLFSGIGGFSLGLERTGGFRTVAFCEIDPYCRAVLRKHWPAVPCFEDVRDLHAGDVGPVDIICGGFPCQDISTAGKGAGLRGDRSGLWSEYRRLIWEIEPTWVIIENVSALRSRGLDQVLGEIAALGYDAEWHCIRAADVGAPHLRDRVWIVAYPQHSDADGLGSHRAAQHQQGSVEFRDEQIRIVGSVCEALAYAHQPRLQGRLGAILRERAGEQLARHGGASEVADSDRESSGRLAIAWSECDQWLVEPDVGRVANGVPSRVDRLRALGNAVVPQIPEIIGRAILEAEAQR